MNNGLSATADEPQLLVDERDGILVATLNRPEKLNAITISMMEALWDAIVRFRDTPELRVMLIRATGRYFCSGVDLKQKGEGMTARTASAIRTYSRLKMRNMHAMYDEMERIEKPIVVAHQATCLGGGLELSLSCDFRLASSNASYGFPEGKFGLLPASNGVSRLTRICGAHWARYLVMAGRRADANRALIMGLVHEVIPAETFEEVVLEFCHDLMAQSAEQLGAAKIAIDMCHDLGRDAGRDVERLANSALMLNQGSASDFADYVGNIGTLRKS